MQAGWSESLLSDGYRLRRHCGKQSPCAPGRLDRWRASLLSRGRLLWRGAGRGRDEREKELGPRTDTAAYIQTQLQHSTDSESRRWLSLSGCAASTVGHGRDAAGVRCDRWRPRAARLAARGCACATGTRAVRCGAAWLPCAQFGGGVVRRGVPSTPPSSRLNVLRFVPWRARLNM